MPKAQATNSSAGIVLIIFLHENSQLIMPMIDSANQTFLIYFFGGKFCFERPYYDNVFIICTDVLYVGRYLYLVVNYILREG